MGFRIRMILLYFTYTSYPPITTAYAQCKLSPDQHKARATRCILSGFRVSQHFHIPNLYLHIRGIDYTHELKLFQCHKPKHYRYYHAGPGSHRRNTICTIQLQVLMKIYFDMSIVTRVEIGKIPIDYLGIHEWVVNSYIRSQIVPEDLALHSRGLKRIWPP